MISNFDVYKVENINDKYMVASGIPKENGEYRVNSFSKFALPVFQQRVIKEQREAKNLHSFGVHYGKKIY